MCENYTYQTTALLMDHSFLFRATYKPRLSSSCLETVSKMQYWLLQTLFVFSHTNCAYSRRATYIVQPHPDYWTCVLQAALSLQGTNCICVAYDDAWCILIDQGYDLSSMAHVMMHNDGSGLWCTSRFHGLWWCILSSDVTPASLLVCWLMMLYSLSWCMGLLKPWMQR